MPAVAAGRALARQLFLETLDEIAVAPVFARTLRWERAAAGGEWRLQLRSGTPEDRTEIEWQRPRQLLVIAAGKAAHAMLAAWNQEWKGQLEAHCPPEELPIIREIVVAPPQDAAEAELPSTRKQVFTAGHPEPNEVSFQAARACLKVVAGMRADGRIVYLISGGGSALLELPLDLSAQPGWSEPAWTLEDWRQTYQALVRSGAGIGEINCVRKHLSAIKGGRLAAAAPAGVPQLSLLWSDVPEAEWEAISSGPTCPDASTVEQAAELVARYRMEMPQSVLRALAMHALPETPKPGDAAFATSRWHVLMDNAAGCQALAARARQAGLHPTIDHTADEWEYRRAGEYLVMRIRELKRADPAACLIAGGEVRVRVRGPAGWGGRNQALALQCATKLADTPLVMLSAGSDGIDGVSPAAGAVVDGSTVQRALEEGIEPREALETFDAYPLFARLGDAIETGATGNNLRDLRLLF